ncbi:hypothetical protein [Pseudoblastomonas halimionae]|nr:hypothetical protein [Alteriqipengyuania halimionae]
MTDHLDPQDEANRRKAIQKQRNLVLGLVLAGLVVLFYAITIVRM